MSYDLAKLGPEIQRIEPTAVVFADTGCLKWQISEFGVPVVTKLMHCDITIDRRPLKLCGGIT